MTKATRTTKKKTQPIKVQMFWTAMDCPPTYEHILEEPFMKVLVDELPKIGNLLRFSLNQLATVRQAPPLVFVRATVQRCEPTEEGFNLYLDQLPKASLSYAELCACIGRTMRGYHPDFGIVEGKLVGVSPKHQIAGLCDASLERWLDPLDEDEIEEDEEEEPVVWVDWSSVFPLHPLSTH